MGNSSFVWKLLLKDVRFSIRCYQCQNRGRRGREQGRERGRKRGGGGGVRGGGAKKSFFTFINAHVTPLRSL